MPDPPRVLLSRLDEERFGYRTAKAYNITRDDLAPILSFCRTKEVELLIARCRATELDVAQAMEREGFHLMDTLIYYDFKFDKLPIPTNSSDVLVRPMRSGEQGAIKNVARYSFEGYFGHYHADERLDKSTCDEVYIDWAYRSASSEGVADVVLVASDGARIVGFATLKMNNPDVGEGILFAVSPEAQGQGVYRAFMVKGMEWCSAQGAKRMMVSTQIINIAVQKVWARLGFEANNAYYTFHKWFDS